MKNLVSQKHLFSAITTIVLCWLTGCAEMNLSLPAHAPQLTAAQEVKVGVAAERRLLQLIGGPRHDEALAGLLESLVRQNVSEERQFTVSVADKSDPALYVLPGNRVVMTRGLLSKMRARAELVALLQHAATLARTAYAERANRASNQAITEILTTRESVYDPGSGSVRLARFFAQAPCTGSCLTGLAEFEGKRSADVPEPILALEELRPAFELMEEARQLEKADNPAQAITGYLNAATMAPDEPQILGYLGMAYLRAGELQTARLNLHKAVELQPDYYMTRMGLGYLYLQQGQVRKANDELAESVRLLPVTENLFLLAEAREKSGDAEGGMSLYRLIVEQDPYSKLGRTAASRLAVSRSTQ